MSTSRVVFCRGCKRVLPDYRELGQVIKDRVRLVSLAKAGQVVVTSMSFAALGRSATIDPEYKVVMDFPKAWNVHQGSRANALNAAQFPCPVCKRYVRWEKSEKTTSLMGALFKRW